ncbi:CLUMA_CG019099, isoform A [Clunio marinus]|uniref:CLUMA_CG019099, isoform A n=1 Tax=Clunio marinus TaxID=568069 RepID=A0A1J1J4X7_9DIPT|nr:CLUMA_CG019099, isoform A [Clunio marinus]
MSKTSGEKTCMVCSDKALGHNFNAITCESCKAFFRRNAISNKKFSCPFSNACEITTITRRFCQKCRLEKCFKVGMKKEFIMSDKDKELKRLKIEQNRNKRKLKLSSEMSSSGDDQEQIQSKKTIKIKEEWSPISATSSVSMTTMDTQSESSTNMDSDEFQTNQTLQSVASDSSVHEIISTITKEPEKASQVIKSTMKTQTEALQIMSKIIQDPNQALVLVSHLIKNPADGMLIINKMMSSPIDALSVFTQFMASPTDALQLIFKIMSSPKDVLQFMTELTKSPQDALEIMKRFMSRAGVADTLAGINQMMIKSTNSSEVNSDSESASNMIKAMLEVNSVDSPNSSIASPSSFQSVRTPNSIASNEHDTNNNDYHHNTEKLLNEICHDIYKHKSTTSSSERNPFDLILNEAIMLEYETPQMITQMKCATTRELNDVEMMKIQELLDSNKALYAPVDEDLSSLVLADCQIKTEDGVDPILLKVINLTAIAIRRLIKMSKKISGFKKMCQEDQIALLKGGCTEMMILRSVMQYDSDHASWKIPHTMNTAKIKADILKLCPKGNVYEVHENFIKTFDLKLRTDENVILILCAITLFCPNRQSLVHHDVIKLEQNSYYFLLRRYLESIYDGCEARQIFLQLLKKIQEVRKLNEDVISVYLDVNPSQVEPLLREIFDLKV